MPSTAAQNVDQESSFHREQSKTFDWLVTSVQKLFHGRTRSNLKLASKSVTPQGSSTNLEMDRDTNHSDPGPPSLPSNAGIVDQGICTTFQDAHHFSIGGNARITAVGHQQNVINRGPHGMDTLEKYMSFDALHDSSAQDPERCCHPGTREDVLAQMRNWADDLTRPERILWLHGPAGVGKSAIAQTIAYSYGRDKVGATFFFFRSDPMRNDGNRLFPTIAWQLAISVPIVKDLVTSVLEQYPDIPRKTIEAQFDQLIAQPFLSISGDESPSPSSTRVVIIDGLDECSDLNLHRRILKIIGNAVTKDRFPLRFIISCRTEAHIEDFFAQFQSPTLKIDLANVDSAYRDIETYLTSEFARIAVDQDIDPEVWPGQGIIDTLVSKSSGQFVYASTVVKYTGDEYESAVAQLNIVLGLKPITGKSPFSELDALYIEILQRQPDQGFLKELLPIIVARSALVYIKLDNFDEAMLLGLDEKEMNRKLRGMHSLFKFTPVLDVHHKSFLDFLDTSSRSGKYHVCKCTAKKRYMRLITDNLNTAASKAIGRPDRHEGDHFQPRFAKLINSFPFCTDLPLNDLEEILQPLLIIQEKLLQLPHMSVPWKPRACNECWTFSMIDDLLLHLTYIQRKGHSQISKYSIIRPLTAVEEKQSIPQLESTTCLSLLLAHLRCAELTLDKDMICLLRALVRSDPTEIAMQIRSMSDAQNLVDLIFCLNRNQCFNSWFGAAGHNATRLAIAIYGRVPLLPQSLFLNLADIDIYQGKVASRWTFHDSIHQKCFNIFVQLTFSHPNLAQFLGYSILTSAPPVLRSISQNCALTELRKSAKPSVSEIQQIIFKVAGAIQYVHSFGFLYSLTFIEGNIYLDPDNNPEVQIYFISHPNSSRWLKKYDYTYSTGEEDNVLCFGQLFYKALFNVFNYETRLNNRPVEPEIPDNVWELIQWCCAKDPKDRPTMDQVVQEMESWTSLGQAS